MTPNHLSEYEDHGKYATYLIPAILKQATPGCEAFFFTKDVLRESKLTHSDYLNFNYNTEIQIPMLFNSYHNDIEYDHKAQGLLKLKQNDFIKHVNSWFAVVESILREKINQACSTLNKLDGVDIQEWYTLKLDNNTICPCSEDEKNAIDTLKEMVLLPYKIKHGLIEIDGNIKVLKKITYYDLTKQEQVEFERKWEEEILDEFDGYSGFYHSRKITIEDEVPDKYKYPLNTKRGIENLRSLLLTSKRKGFMNIPENLKIMLTDKYFPLPVT